MDPAKDEIHLDTNVIECFRTGSWKALAANFHLHTVEEVIREAGHRPKEFSDYVKVDTSQVKKDSKVHSVSDKSRADLTLRLQARVSLDAGEEHLLANALQRKKTWFVVSPDKALMRATHYLGHLERLVSLESLLQLIGHKPRQPLRRPFHHEFLQRFRTSLLLEEF